MKSRFLRWGFALAFCLCAFAQPASAAVSPEVARGLAWLQAQVQVDGSVAGEARSIANPEQVRGEVATTLSLLGSPPPQQLLGLIASSSPKATELLARKAIALNAAGEPADAVLALLAASQNADGGFGGEPGFASNPADTAWALLAWADQQTGYEASIKAAVQWLASAQAGSGAWLSSSEGQDTYPASLVIQALSAYRGQFTLTASLSKGRNWLAAQKSGNGSWETDAHTAAALLALLPAVTDASPFRTSVDYLISRQEADASWGGDAFTTSIVLRALTLVAQPVTNPDLASITGVVKDAETGNPLASATVSLNGGQQTVLTDSTGKFLFQALQAGTATVEISASGYRVINTETILSAGAHVDFGSVLLNKSGVSSVTVSGSARYTPPSSGSSSAAYSATITVGGVSVQADSQGKYVATGVPAGSLTLVASFGGFTFEQKFSASAGDSVVINPEIVATAYATGVNIQVVDSSTLAPLSGCAVVVNGYTRHTNSSGVADFAYNLLQVGTSPIAIRNCAGYANAYAQIVVKQGEVVNVQIALARQAVSSGGFVLDGVIIDATTRLPLTGATVAIPSLGLSAVTNSEGRYRIQLASTVTGSIVVTAGASGYLALSQQIGSVATENTLNVSLQPDLPLKSVASIEVVVTDSVSALPLQGAEILISGANTGTLTTGVDGIARIEAANTGVTVIKISHSGRSAVVANLDVKDGVQYRLPVSLVADEGTAIALKGQVIDSQTLQPLAGATVKLSGPIFVSVQSDIGGRYDLSNLVAGEYSLFVSKNAYEEFSQMIRLSQVTTANVPLVQIVAGALPKWRLFGAVIDGDSYERISGVNVVLEEMIPGMGPVARQSVISASDGGFDFDALTSSNVRLMIQVDGYDSIILSVDRGGQEFINIGSINLKKSAKIVAPDLMLRSADRSRMTIDPETFLANGVVSIVSRNNSTYPAGPFDVTLFIDRNQNGELDASDTIVATQRQKEGLAAGAEQRVEFGLSKVQLNFRDEPLSVMIDSQQEVPETIESNNVHVTSSSCATGGAFQDVVICLDVSGSVASFVPIEVEGAIKAIENPNIIPQDGSVRLTVTTSQEALNYNGLGYPLQFPARVITPESAMNLASAMKTWNYGGGTDYLETGARNMSLYLKTLSPASANKTIILVGDGYWAGVGTATTSKVAETVANGVNRIDLIGVGNVNMPALLDNAWPKPANSPGGGNVSVARSSGEIAGAMAQSLANAVRLTDLSVGGLRVEDNGVGHPVSLTARVGNGGGASQATKLRFYQGARLLGEMPVASLATGAYVDIRLENVTLSGTEDIRAVVDEDKANSECNLSNNTHSIPLLASLPVAQIVVSTDQPSYATGASVSLHSVSTNAGAIPASLKATLKVEDASGAEVVSFGEKDLGVVAAGAAVSYDEVWSSAGFRAGAYALVGTLTASDGSIVAQSRAAFSVSASAGATIRPVTDKASYGAGEWVSINAVVTNPAFNASLLNTRVALKVIDPKGGVAYTVTRALSELGAMATREIALPRALLASAVGSYTVEAVLSNAQGLELARGTARFAVTADVSTVLSGEVALAREEIMRGDLQLRGDTIHNRSGLAISALRIARVILRQSDGKEVHRVESSLAFAVGETKTLPQLSIESLNLEPDQYIAVLQVAQTAQIQRNRKAIRASSGGWQVLSAASFSVKQGMGGGGGSGGSSSVQGVPTLNEWALVLLALLIVCAAMRQRALRR